MATLQAISCVPPPPSLLAVKTALKFRFILDEPVSLMPLLAAGFGVFPPLIAESRMGQRKHARGIRRRGSKSLGLVHKDSFQDPLPPPPPAPSSADRKPSDSSCRMDRITAFTTKTILSWGKTAVVANFLGFAYPALATSTDGGEHNTSLAYAGYWVSLIIVKSSIASCIFLSRVFFYEIMSALATRCIFSTEVTPEQAFLLQ